MVSVVAVNLGMRVAGSVGFALMLAAAGSTCSSTGGPATSGNASVDSGAGDVDASDAGPEVRLDSVGPDVFDGGTEVGDGDAAQLPGCFEFRVSGASLAPDISDPWWPSPQVGQWGDRDHLWRDANGLHVAWTAARDSGGFTLVWSTFDPATGEVVAHRLFPELPQPWFLAAAAGPSGKAALAVGWSPDGGEAQGLLLVGTDDPSATQLVALGPWPQDAAIRGVGWDGEAWSVNAFGKDDGTQYVMRVAPDGSVVLPPTAYGLAVGYSWENQFATDPVSGLSVGVTGVMTGATYLTGHLRDGTATPDPTKPTTVQLARQGWDDSWNGYMYRGTVTAIAGGAVVAWVSGGSDKGTMTAFLEPIAPDLSPTADVIPIPGEPTDGGYGMPEVLSYSWISIQPLPTGWWLATATGVHLDEVFVTGGTFTERRRLVSLSDQARKDGHGADPKYLTSALWGDDEIWIGYVENGGGVTPNVYRVVRGNHGCTYKAIIDEALGY